MSATAIAIRPEFALPPMFSVEAEKSVLGGLLAKPELSEVVVASLAEWMFYREAHRRIWRAVQSLCERGVSLDVLSLQDRIVSAGDLDAAGGTLYLAELSDWVPTTSEAHLAHHAEIVRRHAIRRRIHEHAVAVQEFVRAEADAPIEHLRAEAERMIAEAVPDNVRTAGGGFVAAKTMLMPELDRLERITRGEEMDRGVKTGLECVDGKLLGMQRGDLILVAARPSMGKSSLGVCNIVADAAIRQRKRTAVFTLETRMDVVVRRLMGSEARVNIWAVEKTRKMGDSGYPQLADAVAKINVAPLHLDYTPGLTLDQMRARLRDLQREHGAIDLVVVDYLQLMTHPKTKSSYDEVSAISAGLKRIAGEFDVPMVALSQLSRAVESRPDKRPQMSDLRESGRLEQDADVVMLLFRPEYYFPTGMPVKRGKETTTMDVTGKAEIILAKVREGETGTAHCAWEKSFTHFEDLRGFQ